SCCHVTTMASSEDASRSRSQEAATMDAKIHALELSRVSHQGEDPRRRLRIQVLWEGEEEDQVEEVAVALEAAYARGANVKYVYLIRHGEGHHNVFAQRWREEALAVEDEPLLVVEEEEEERNVVV